MLHRAFERRSRWAADTAQDARRGSPRLNQDSCSDDREESPPKNQIPIPPSQEPTGSLPGT